MEREVTLQEMLDARERRVIRQQKLLNDHRMSLVCFTMNIAGPVKNSKLIRNGFELGNRLLRERFNAMDIRCILSEDISEVTGSEAYYVIDADPFYIKRITVDIENESLLGKLFDIDVLKPDGVKVEREEIHLLPRRCLICGAPSKVCARSRIHSVSELQERTGQILKSALDTEDYRYAAGMACRAILYEACTTPKPGLVDRLNSGSHRDMDIFSFMDSASVLWPYFETCTRVGRKTSDLPATETFIILRETGRKAEADMFAATRGVNTHKGAIFSLGILCAALGRLPREQWMCPDDVLKECAAITKGLIKRDFMLLTPENAHTVGEKLYLEYGITGVRGQMEEGLPAVRDVGLPTLREGCSRGLSVNDAGCVALLALIAASTDTNLIARSNITVWKETVIQIKEKLAKNPYPDRQILQELDREFIEKNLSPGGSADLLAVCYLLYFLETEV